MPERRTLDYAQIEAIMPDVNRLLQGHETAGHWTLGQILDHLAKTISLTARAPRESRPTTPATPEQDVARQAFFQARTIPTGREIPTPRIVPDPNADPKTAAESLQSAIDRITSFEGPFPTHPALGPLSREDWLQFHCVHCAHHLSFAVPA